MNEKEAKKLTAGDIIESIDHDGKTAEVLSNSGYQIRYKILTCPHRKHKIGRIYNNPIAVMQYYEIHKKQFKNIQQNYDI